MLECFLPLVVGTEILMAYLGLNIFILDHRKYGMVYLMIILWHFTLPWNSWYPLSVRTGRYGFQVTQQWYPHLFWWSMGCQSLEQFNNLVNLLLCSPSKTCTELIFEHFEIFIISRSYTSSLCTGYCVSESVYYAPVDWLVDVDSVFMVFNA